MGDETERHDMEQLAETEGNLMSSFRQLSASFRSASATSDLVVVPSSFRANNDDEVELQWAAIERLPTFERLRTSLFDHQLINDGDASKAEEDVKVDRKREVIDVTELGALERRFFIQKLISKIEDDNLRLLKKLKERIDRQESMSLFYSQALITTGGRMQSPEQ
ncbi:hypothetical protein V6N13_087078 [Hibiscus sabdariffa]|uniref:Uncharacterized protein n=1 Tax=Hibiscus sabdariffa TaxID=183260 RepID=A0ABR2FV51_9ROSI